MQHEPSIANKSDVVSRTFLKYNSLCAYNYNKRPYLLTSSLIVKIHRPFAFSPHVITDMTVQFWRPSFELSSFLVPNSCTLVPNLFYFYICNEPSRHFDVILTCWRCQIDFQRTSPSIIDIRL